jgi:hypothetical protein
MAGMTPTFGSGFGMNLDNQELRRNHATTEAEAEQ